MPLSFSHRRPRTPFRRGVPIREASRSCRISSKPRSAALSPGLRCSSAVTQASLLPRSRILRTDLSFRAPLPRSSLRPGQTLLARTRAGQIIRVWPQTHLPSRGFSGIPNARGPYRMLVVVIVDLMPDRIPLWEVAEWVDFELAKNVSEIGRMPTRAANTLSWSSRFGLCSTMPAIGIGRRPPDGS